MINNETFSIELYSLTKLYLMLDELDEKEQALVRLRENNKNIDTSEYESKKMSKLAGAVGAYNRAFYSIFFYSVNPNICVWICFSISINTSVVSAPSFI